MSEILVIVAHPDDEILGCSDTTARQVHDGDSVHTTIMADVVTSRDKADQKLRSASANKAATICVLP